MSLEREIRNWLSSDGSFASGVDLYSRTGGGPHLADFRSYCSRQYLPPGAKDQLRQILEKTAPREAEALYITKPAPVSQATQQEPESVSALREQGKAVKKRESYLHAQMVFLSRQAETPERKEELYSIAQELIDEITPELDRIYDTIKEFERTGKVPMGNEAQLIKETVQKIRKRDSVTTIVYRLRSRIKKGGMTKEEEAKTKAQLAEKEAEWEQLDKELMINEESTR
jgi:hypothetical protein